MSSESKFTLLKDFPQYGKKAGDVIENVTLPIGVPLKGATARWQVWSTGVNKNLDVVPLIIGTDVKLEFVENSEPSKPNQEQSKPNWVLIGGIVLIGYFILKEIK